MQAEVAVVGSGVVGSATALELARRGAAVALLEAEPEPGLARERHQLGDPPHRLRLRPRASSRPS